MSVGEEPVKNSGGKKGLKQAILTYVKEHIAAISFLVIFIGGGYILDLENTWDSGDSTPHPWHFSVLIYDKTRDRLREYSYPVGDEVIKHFEENDIEYTYLLPVNAERDYPFGDTDTFFSVDRLSGQEQVVKLDYELGLLNHSSSTYRATDKSVKPMSADNGGLPYFSSFLAWLVFLLLYATLRWIIYFWRGISALWRHREVAGESVQANAPADGKIQEDTHD